MDDSKKFGKEVRRLRKERNISSARLAHFVGLDTATMNRIELEHRRPPEVCPFVVRILLGLNLEFSSNEAQSLLKLAVSERFPNIVDFSPESWLMLFAEPRNRHNEAYKQAAE